jgi:hypothetical protein
MSSSYELDSSFIASALVKLESSITSQSQKWRAAIWNYYCKPIEEENQAYLYYTYYTNLIKSLYNTSILENIKKYIKVTYKITIKKTLSKNQIAINL